jgi:hypothetical protein
MPPRMLPTATDTSPDSAALTVMAISGRFVATASTMSPPSALPMCSRSSSTSVVFESWMPATQVTAAAATKITIRSQRGRESTRRGNSSRRAVSGSGPRRSAVARERGAAAPTSTRGGAVPDPEGGLDPPPGPV